MSMDGDIKTKKFVPTAEQLAQIAEINKRQNGESIRKIDSLNVDRLNKLIAEQLRSVGYTIEDLKNGRVDVDTIIKALEAKKAEAVKATDAKQKAAEENGGKSFGL